MQIWIDHRGSVILEIARSKNKVKAIVTHRQKKKVIQTGSMDFENGKKRLDTTTKSLYDLINRWLTSAIPPSAKIKELLEMAKTKVETPDVEISTVKEKRLVGHPQVYQTFSFVSYPQVQIPCQANKIVEIVKTHKKIDRAALLIEMEKVINTKQPIDRILSYYQKYLTDLGTITIDKGE